MTRFCFLFALILTSGCSGVTDLIPPDSIKEKSEDLAFELEIQSLVKKSHESEMKALEDQKAVLDRIELSISNLDTKLEASSKAIEPSKSESEDSTQESTTNSPESTLGGSSVVKSTGEFEPEPQDDSKEDSDPKSNWASNALVRQSGPTWNWEGKWNVSTSTAEEHLNEHGIAVSGLSMKEMQLIHDNIHNGYGYLYGLESKAVKAVSTPTRTRQVFSVPKRIFQRTVRYSTCPNGRCPQ